MSKTSSSTRMQSKEEMDSDRLEKAIEDEKAADNSFFAIQRPFINLVEDYLILHPVEGKKMTLKIFCERAGLTVANVTAIMNGSRWVAKCGRETVKKLAAILEIPVLQIYILSGFITTSDIIFSTNIDETLSAIHRRMMKDGRMINKVPNEAIWNTWPLSAKLSLCMMYEEMIGRVLLRYAEIQASEDLKVGNRYDPA